MSENETTNGQGRDRRLISQNFTASIYMGEKKSKLLHSCISAAVIRNNLPSCGLVLLMGLYQQKALAVNQTEAVYWMGEQYG